jgi:hypothetical protein
MAERPSFGLTQDNDAEAALQERRPAIDVVVNVVPARRVRITNYRDLTEMDRVERIVGNLRVLDARALAKASARKWRQQTRLSGCECALGSGQRGRWCTGDTSWPQAHHRTRV